MKKRCTNSACRRVFSTNTRQMTPCCPHCGKVYPRMASMPLYYVELCSAKGLRSLARSIALYRRTVAVLPVQEVKALLKGVELRPIPLGPFSRGEALQVQEGWRALGFDARLTQKPEKKLRPPGQSY